MFKSVLKKGIVLYKFICDKTILFFNIGEEIMRCAVNLYTTEKTKKMLPRIMHKLRTRKLQPGIWLITIASNKQNLLDIFHSVYYMQPMFEKLNPDIVGIAESEDAAKELLIRITEEIYRETGSFDVRTYFQFQE